MNHISEITWLNKPGELIRLPLQEFAPATMKIQFGLLLGILIGILGYANFFIELPRLSSRGSHMPRQDSVGSPQ